MVEQEELIKFLNLEEKFNEYLIESSNKQMLFSGPFGSGKTTFLKTFFDDRKNDYTVIHLYPVNYSLHNNTDIYEILKYDIILELIGLGAFKKEDVSNLLKYTFAVSQTIDKNIGKFISLFSDTGKKLVELIKLSIESFKNLETHNVDLNDLLLQVRSFG